MRGVGIPLLAILFAGAGCLVLPLAPLVAQSLPPIPAIPTLRNPLPSGVVTPTPLPAYPSSPLPLPQPSVRPTPMPVPLGDPRPTVTFGADLRQLVQLFINDAYRAGENPSAVNYSTLYEKLLAQRVGNPQTPLEVEYDFLRATLKQYGEAGDRLLTPVEFNTLLNRPRPPLMGSSPIPGVLAIKMEEITPNTPTELRQLLRENDASRGVILDLRGATAYDPQVMAAVARLFLPTVVKPLVITTDRFQQETTWDHPETPVAADRALSVLIDENTQQGAVLLAAQLGISANTVVLGRATSGTEFQRKFFVLPSGAAVELTIGRWKTGDGRTLNQGLVPLQTLSSPSENWIGAALQAMPMVQREAVVRPTIFVKEGQVGRFALGLDLREFDGGSLGSTDTITAQSGNNVFQPNSDLRIYYLQDYIVFGYRPPSILRSYFANRIYTVAPNASTAEGISVGATYDQVIKTYGKLGENGFNDIAPFPVGSREFGRSDRYYVNYDALGLGFIFQTGSNQVVGIGLYKAGN